MTDTDPQVEAAIDTVARRALAFAAVELAEKWGDDYPELGGHDFERVTARAVELAPWPSIRDTARAFALLEARAEGVKA